jgi:hypothetical protein
MPHLSVEACSGSDAKEIRGGGVSRWAVRGLRPDKVLSSQRTCGSDHLLRVRAGGGGVRIGTINGLGAELPKRDAVVFTGPPCCLTAPSDPCGEGNSPLGGAFVPRRRSTGYRERPDEGAQQSYHKTERGEANKFCITSLRLMRQNGSTRSSEVKRGARRGVAVNRGLSKKRKTRPLFVTQAAATDRR